MYLQHTHTDQLATSTLAEHSLGDVFFAHRDHMDFVLFQEFFS